MWLGIGPESWAQLWSGAIGSFVAAVIGGLVALMVVHMANSHNQKLASDARELAALADLIAGSEELTWRQRRVIP
ncbi:hypothetical protein J3A64_004782 [Pseudarthrobacter sp. PvP004]|nr:hypothetical protein [Pseudarthrobacter sp. PvP004]